MLKVELGIEDLAKYPFLQEAGEYVRRLNLELEELGQPDYADVLQRAKERVVEAVKKGRVSEEVKEPDTELLSFPLALMMVKATGLEYLASRYALAEALRVERLLGAEKKSTIAYIFKTALNIDLQEASPPSSRVKSDFRIRVTEYLKRATAFHSPEWKLVNRIVDQGYVYLTTHDLIRLIREEIRRIIYGRIRTLTVPRLPASLQKEVEEIAALVPKPSVYPSRVLAPEEYPPCVAHAVDLLQKGQNLPHYGRFLLTTYLLNIGRGVEEVLRLYSKVPDFNERVSRYQVEHIAGLRGGRVKYRCPSCRTLQTYSFCFRDKSCGKIKNPLQYGRFKVQPRRQGRKRRGAGGGQGSSPVEEGL